MANLSHLRIVVESSEPLILVEMKDHQLEVSGPMKIILDMMASSLHFNYTLQKSLDGRWGLQDVNESFNGMVGMLHRNEADFALVPITVNGDRHKVVHFTHPLLLDDLRILSRLSEKKEFNFRLLNIFSLDLWIAIVASLFVISAVSSFMCHVLKLKYPDNLQIHLYMSILVGRGIPATPNNDHMRLLFAMWLIFCTLVYNCFLTQVLASLVSKNIDNIDNMSEVVSRKDMVPVLETGGDLENQFKCSNKAAYREIWRRIEKSNNSLLNSVELRSNEFMDRVQKGEAVAIVEGYVVLSMLSKRSRTRKECNYYVSKESMATIPIAMALSRRVNKKLLIAIDNWISRLMPSGLCDYWMAEHYRKGARCQSYVVDKKQLKPINILAVKTPFLMWAVGLLIADIVLICEFLNHRQRSHAALNDN